MNMDLAHCPLVALAVILVLAPAAPALAQSRGALLYSTHCIACHSEQMHWRQKKLVTDWPSLKAQVRRWQAEAALDWSDDDVAEVARYLNEEFYRLPQATAPATQSGFASRWEREGARRVPGPAGPQSPAKEGVEGPRADP
jgi:mono/diheme cytochrome c family protein